MKSLTVLGDTPSKKNSRKLFFIRNKPVFAPSTNYEKWHRSAQNQLYGAKSLSGLSDITLTSYPSTRRKSDLTNKAESVMDLLVDCGIIPDDNWFEVPKVVLQFGEVDKQNPRCEIVINQINE